jgi:hypothetical protein
LAGRQGTCAFVAGERRPPPDAALIRAKAGDTILFGKYSGQEIKLDGVEYLIMKEDEVLAAIEGGASAVVPMPPSARVVVPNKTATRKGR